MINCNVHVLENSHIIQIGNKNGPDILDGSGYSFYRNVFLRLSSKYKHKMKVHVWLYHSALDTWLWPIEMLDYQWSRSCQRPVFIS